jgi:hypothetical protein
MPAPAMKRWENIVALVATVLAAGALLPIPASPRFICAGSAIVMLLILCGLRLRAHIARRDAPSSSETYTRVERIRAARGPRRR